MPPVDASKLLARYEVPGTESVTHIFTFQYKKLPPEIIADALPDLVEHAVAAQRLRNRVRADLTKAMAEATGEEELGTAVVLADGTILDKDKAFVRFMESEYSDWEGARLPFPVEWEEKLATHGMVHGRLFMKVERIGDQYHVRIRGDRRAPEVSEREFEIATLIGDGLTFKEIGRKMNLAPSTVSSHLYNLYSKIGVRRRSQLVTWIAHNKGRMNH